ncbi:MAG: cytochrome C oxidase subunit IV family protein [Nitrospirae bacterium]|nr:cytochrome C oxidase subunit IV family protein [Nitrospirota bacterium]
MKERNNHIIGFKTYVIVWLCLLILTVLTVAVSGMKLGMSGSLTSVIIATLKASLILLFFMHLKYERFLITAMLLLTVMTIAVIIGLTFFDVWYRY